MQVETHQDQRHDTAPTDRSAATDCSGDGDAVSWYLSPGYGTHLHAYELAMLPLDAGAPAVAPDREHS